MSGLSPYLRHRLLLEQEVLAAVRSKHPPSSAEKFTHEVFWRTYFKGWLEHRPSVWRDYYDALTTVLAGMASDDHLALRCEAATNGATGIEPFDAWAAELTDTGYLHNHARMWFASIWIFTLRLPWQLGADFFLRHLLDGDPASNTLSWRWVAGLHTQGKVYLARPENIARYAGRRFGDAPRGLEQLVADAEPLTDAARHDKVEPAWPAWSAPTGSRVGWLLTEDDLMLDLPGKPAAVAALAPSRRSVLEPIPKVTRFTTAALNDALERAASQTDARVSPVFASAPSDVRDWARAENLDGVIWHYAPVGPVQDSLGVIRRVLTQAGVPVHVYLRPYDQLCWPHATAGFYRLKKQIPTLLERLGLAGVSG